MGFWIKKWKVSGDCQNIPRPRRHNKLKYRDRQVLPKEIKKNIIKLMAKKHRGLWFRRIPSSRSLLFLGFFDRDTTHKPLITKYSCSFRVRWHEALRN
ncbi:hypothetical protein TNCV_3151501 [Trichonephila clavipes]|nr:hypothetical protein TNCV_3151501 [Trichonephila clavipes]